MEYLCDMDQIANQSCSAHHFLPQVNTQNLFFFLIRRYLDMRTTLFITSQSDDTTLKKTSTLYGGGPFSKRVGENVLFF